VRIRCAWLVRIPSSKIFDRYPLLRSKLFSTEEPTKCRTLTFPSTPFRDFSKTVMPCVAVSPDDGLYFEWGQKEERGSTAVGFDHAPDLDRW